MFLHGNRQRANTMSNQTSTDYHPLNQEFRQYSGDEISLFDIALVLYRRRGIVLGTLILCLVAALGFSVIKGTAYEYSTAITIGTIDDEIPIESPEAVKNRLEKAYIPGVLSKIAAAHGGDLEDVKYKVNVVVPKKTDFVVISSKVTESDAEEIQKILKDLVVMVIDAHNKQLENKRDVLKHQITDVASNKALYLASVGSAGNADSVVLSEINNELTTLKVKLRQFHDSSMQFGATRSLKPVSLSKWLIVTLGAIFGLILGIFVAFFSEFVFKVRQEMAKREV